MVSLDSFADYQRHRAWTWEWQALVRARGVAGSPATLTRFDAIRSEVLALAARSRSAARRCGRDAHAHARRTRSQSRGDRFDLKQGEGGLVDLEFLLQYLVLARAHRTTDLLIPRSSSGMIAALAHSGFVAHEQAVALADSHRIMLRRSLDCTLDRRPRVVVLDAEVETARATIRDVCRVQGLVFV